MSYNVAFESCKVTLEGGGRYGNSRNPGQPLLRESALLVLPGQRQTCALSLIGNFTPIHCYSHSHISRGRKLISLFAGICCDFPRDLRRGTRSPELLAGRKSIRWSDRGGLRKRGSFYRMRITGVRKSFMIEFCHAIRVKRKSRQ